MGWVNANTPAAKAGIQIGDRIVRIDGVSESHLGTDRSQGSAQPEPASEMLPSNATVKSSIRSSRPSPAGAHQYGTIGWVPKEPNVALTSIEPGMPATQAGMKLGDIILKVNGQPIPHIAALVEMLSRTKDQPLEIVALRQVEQWQTADQKLTFNIKPVLAPSRLLGRVRLSHRRRQRSNQSREVVLCPVLPALS